MIMSNSKKQHPSALPLLAGASAGMSESFITYVSRDMLAL